MKKKRKNSEIERLLFEALIAKKLTSLLIILCWHITSLWSQFKLIWNQFIFIIYSTFLFLNLQATSSACLKNRIKLKILKIIFASKFQQNYIQIVATLASHIIQIHIWNNRSFVIYEVPQMHWEDGNFQQSNSCFFVRSKQCCEFRLKKQK